MNENIYFETIKCEDFEIFNLEYHNKRVANTIGLNINLQETMT
jgi:4-amino-4-deoxychorismate lyase